MKKFAFLLLFMSQFALSQTNVDKLIDSLTIAKDDTAKVRISQKISWQLRHSDWKRALHYIEYCEDLTKKIDSEELTAAANVKIAEIYNDKDALDIALSYYLKAYHYYNLKNDVLKYKLQGSLAIIYARLNNKDKAMVYFNKLLNYYIQQKDVQATAKAYNNIGKLYFSNNQQDSAMVYFNKSLHLSKQVKDVELETLLYNNLGLCYVSQNDFDNAKVYFEKSKKLAEQNDDDKTRAWIYNSLSQLYLAKKQPDSALYYSKSAEELLKDQKYSFENLSTVLNIYNSYVQKEDYKNATQYIETYNEIRDSLNIELKAVNVEKLKLEHQHKENEELRDLKESKKQFKYLIFGFGLLILILVMVIILLRYRNKLTQAKLEKELFEAKKKELDANLELKNKELITRSMIEIQRAEITEHILDDLKQIKLQASPKKEAQEAISGIIKKLEKNNNDDDIWKEFELHYGQVYETFYKILEERHPELTYRDKRLCALLKLNLTTKEISRITGQSVKSLENARTRLRKKLNLTNTDQNLTNYLAGLE